MTTREFASYRWPGGRIAELWVAPDDMGMLAQLRAAGSESSRSDRAAR